MERKIRGEEKKAEMELRKLRIDVITTAREICQLTMMRRSAIYFLECRHV